MGKQKTYKQSAPAAASPFDQARDELFSHILRCGVLDADPEHQKDWMTPCSTLPNGIPT
jgi:hypothetical protein